MDYIIAAQTRPAYTQTRDLFGFVGETELNREKREGDECRDILSPGGEGALY